MAKLRMLSVCSDIGGLDIGAEMTDAAVFAAIVATEEESHDEHHS